MTTLATIILVIAMCAILFVIHAALIMFITQGMGEKELQEYYDEMMRQNYLNNKNNLL